MRGQPGEAGLQQHDLQVGELGEHALADQRRQRGLEGGGLRGVVLGVVGGPAERRDRMAIGAAGVDADRQPVLLGGGVYRPVVTLAQRHVVHHQQQDLHEALVRRRRG